MDQKLWGKICNFGHFGGIFTPLTHRGSKIRFFPGSRVINICVYQLCLTFWRVSEKFNGWIKSYGAKSAIFGHFWPFWGYFTPFLPPRGATRPIPEKSFTYFLIYIMPDICEKFQENPRYGSLKNPWT